ncbi:MAG: copper homeostasis protein CutC [Planctomycetota bacterium]
MPRSELLCTDLASVALAARIGADRIELCAALEVGGVTPGPGLLAAALETSRAEADGAPPGLVVLVRPRRGDFVYDAGDFRAALADVESARAAGASGVATGVLDADGRVDVARTRELVDAARPMPMTFHRALDRTPDLLASAETLAEIGVARLLTSGGAVSAWEGRAELKRLAAELGGTVEIVAAGGVRGDNAARLITETGVGAIHGSCGRTLEARDLGPRLGSSKAPPESERSTLDETSARAFVAAARTGGGPAPLDSVR